MLGFTYSPRACASELTAVALQFRCGEGLVNIFNGVGTDHCSAPEQKQGRSNYNLNKGMESGF